MCVCILYIHTRGVKGISKYTPVKQKYRTDNTFKTLLEPSRLCRSHSSVGARLRTSPLCRGRTRIVEWSERVL